MIAGGTIVSPCRLAHAPSARPRRLSLRGCDRPRRLPIALRQRGAACAAVDAPETGETTRVGGGGADRISDETHAAPVPAPRTGAAAAAAGGDAAAAADARTAAAEADPGAADAVAAAASSWDGLPQDIGAAALSPDARATATATDAAAVRAAASQEGAPPSTAGSPAALDPASESSPADPTETSPLEAATADTAAAHAAAPTAASESSSVAEAADTAAAAAAAGESEVSIVWSLRVEVDLICSTLQVGERRRRAGEQGGGATAQLSLRLHTDACPAGPPGLYGRGATCESGSAPVDSPYLPHASPCLPGSRAHPPRPPNHARNSDCRAL
jgi:hypothetical protein